MSSTGATPSEPGNREKAAGKTGVLQDPWGLKRAENLITSLTGVLGARVVATALGEVTEIHVLTTSEVQAKQVVRNIESALMAQLGLKVDHRKISVAQTAEVRALEGAAGAGPAPGAGAGEAVERAGPRNGHRVVLFQNVEIRPSAKRQRVEVVARIESGGREAEGVAEATDTMRNRVEAAARAAALALEELFGDPALALEGAKLVEAFDKTFCLVALQGLSGRETRLLTGACEVRESAERAAILAVLDAVNRWAEGKR